MNKKIEEIDKCFATVQRIVNELKIPENSPENYAIEFDAMQKDCIVSCMNLNMYIDKFVEKLV